MKKIFALLLSIVMMLSLAVPAFAEETADTRESVVSLTLDPSMESYTLTIPATIEIDITKDVTTVPITLKDVNFVWNTYLAVYVTAANWTADAYETDECSSYLVNTEDETKRIPYLLTERRAGCIMDSSDNKLCVADAGIDEESGETKISSYCDIELEILGDYPGAGKYTDTLTFTVELSRDRYW